MKKSTESSSRRGENSALGFTLLEVLAAVAILGIWFSVLASVAIQGQRSEGENERRIRASLIADQVLLELEIGIDDEEFPIEVSDEFERDEFTVEVESKPLSGLGFEDMDEGYAALLTGDLAELALDLHAIEVTVRWTEGHADESVSRLTYFFDNTRLLEILGEIPEDELGDDPDAGDEGSAGGGA